MKKSVVIIIAIIYIASIVSINFFGMKMSVYNEKIPVIRVECTNVSEPEKGIEVLEYEGKKLISIEFSKPANPSAATEEERGTMLQLFVRVYPDNAESTRVRYQPKLFTNNAEFYKGPNGEDTGLILFYGKAYFEVDLFSTDGRNISTTIIIWAK